MPSSRMTALLGLLAIAGYENRHRLGEMLAQFTGEPQEGATPRPGTMQSGGQGGGQGGGLLQGLHSLFRGSQSGGPTGNPAGGMLSGLLGGGSVPGLMSGGLSELVDRFASQGQGQVAQSWIGTGPNQDIGADQLEQILGKDTIESLTQHTGLSRDDLLMRLKTVLPAAVDKLTPEGHVPSEAELSHQA